MDALSQFTKSLQEHWGMILLLAFVVGPVIAFVAGRSGMKKLAEAADGLRDRLARAESQAKEQRHMVTRMRAEQGTVASLALSLPSVVRELNRSNFEARSVPGLILQLAESIFQPAQILFYRTCVLEGGDRELRLANHQGLSEVPEELRRIAFGHGKIGWVAENRLDMLKAGWINLAHTEGLNITDNHALLEADIMGPLVHAERNEEEVLGVLCIGSPGVRPRDEKLMFQLVTNLGSLALVNADYRKKLRAQANHDGLTGLLNKRFFMSELAEIIVKSESKAQPLSLFLFDIDHFKNYNDTNGHPAGDELLRGLGRLIQNNVRPGDSCCRYGGEEFIVGMPGTDARAAIQVAERIRAAIEDHRFAHAENQPDGKVTISGGVAAFPKDGTDINELTRNADEALYECKRAGRNRVARYRGIQIGMSDDEIDAQQAEASVVKAE